MKNIKVVLYDIEEKSIVEHESMSDGELEFHGVNDKMFVEIFLKVDELALGNKIYSVLARRFSIDSEKLIISVKLKK